jgi:plasmid stabilization system protein ParE
MRAFAWLLCGVLVFAGLSAYVTPGSTASHLPRFTEEREAAALFFLKKHVPEVLPLLDELKRSNPAQYQQEVREIFQATEMLADLRDDPPRHDLELKYWKTETKAHALAAKLSTSKEEERAKVEIGLREMARELVDLDIQFLELRADQLDKELGEVKDELARTRGQLDKSVRTKYDVLLEQGKKPKKD